MSKVKASDEFPELKKKTTMMSTGEPEFSDDDSNMGENDEIV